MQSVNPENGESSNDMGGVGETLRPSEALDPDDVRNDGGDAVVDPPEQWTAADEISEQPEGESLDDKLAAEQPEPSADAVDKEAAANTETEVRPDDAMDRIQPDRHGADSEQVDDLPEDGDSYFPVVE